MAQVIPMGPWSGSKQNQRTKRWLAIQQVQAMPGFQGFQKTLTQAQITADRVKGVVYRIAGTPAGDGFKAEGPTHGVVAQAAGGGSKGAGSAGAPSAPGIVAANASQKQFTGGGTQDVGATNIQNAGVAVLGEFMGANFRTMDTKLPEGMSPDCRNVDGMTIAGALGPRPGLIAMYPKRNDQSNIAVAYGGRSILFLSRAVQQSLHMTAITALDRSDIGESLASTVVARVKRLKPLWHPQRDISQVAPVVRLTVSSAATGPAFSVSMPSKYRKAAPQVASVDQIIVRVSGTTYPRDRDGKDGLNTRIVSGLDYSTWGGTSLAVSANGDSVASTGATMYVSVWGVGKRYVTPRGSLKVQVS